MNQLTINLWVTEQVASWLENSTSAYLLMFSLLHFQNLKRSPEVRFVVYNTKKLENLFPVTTEFVAGAMRK